MARTNAESGGDVGAEPSLEIFRTRRERVLEALGDDAMVLPAAPPLLRSRDSEVPYRPDSELHYLTGFTEPGSLLLLRGFANEDRSVLFARPRDAEAERWTGPRLGVERARTTIGVDRAMPMGEVYQHLPRLLAGAARVHYRLGYHPSLESLVVRALRTARLRGARKGTGPRAVVDPGGILDEMRLRKDPVEVEAIRRATRLTVEGFREGLATARPGAGEWQVQAALEAAFLREGRGVPAFATIVGAGSNACVLHYVENRARLGPDDLVLVDAGAEVDMYCGDVTRTFPASGRFLPEQQEVYRVVEGARSAAVAAIRPGASMEDVHRAAVISIVAGLVDLGILSGDPEGLVERKLHEAFFPHRTSHWLGMDTHDPGDYVSGGTSRVLEPGMVLTVEPGLYFGGPVPPRPHDEGTDGDVPEVPSHLLGIGVRIEDDVLVTDGGAEILNEGLPTAPEEIAAMVGGAPDHQSYGRGG